MKSILLISLFFPFILSAQMSLDECLKKLKIQENEVVSSNESVLMFPRSFIYSTTQTDSAVYLSCLSKDKKQFVSYFENTFYAEFFPIRSMILRSAGTFVDTVIVEPLEKRLSHFTKSSILNPSTKHIVFYYWTPSVLDRHLIKNYLFYYEYVQKHPEMNIQLVPVLVD